MIDSSPASFYPDVSCSAPRRAVGRAQTGAGGETRRDALKVSKSDALMEDGESVAGPLRC